MTLHHFSSDISGIPVPERLNSPYEYTPHPLCVTAFGEICTLIHSTPSLLADAAKGKMIGILAVEVPGEKQPCYLAAFSGLLDGRNRIDGFVPPLFDLMDPDGFFKKGEAEISALNRKIEQTEKGTEYRSLVERLTSLKSDAGLEISEYTEFMKKAKAERDARRVEMENTPGTDAEEYERLLNESRFQKAELHRIKLKWKERISEGEALLSACEREIIKMKEQRKSESAKLQERLFRNYILTDNFGNEKDILEIFRDFSAKKGTGEMIPPAGTGECAAPKLFQYAFSHQMKPLAIAEFWFGQSPANSMKVHGRHYPACRNKCLPLLEFMLKGLQISQNDKIDNLQIIKNCQNINLSTERPEILYEDEYVVAVNKPAGMLSMPGKDGSISLYEYLKEKYAGEETPLPVHRLDKYTSGIILAAKNIDVYRQLQRQFALQQVEKSYVAILSGIPKGKTQGTIDLPIAPDPENRPRQTVNAEYGKKSVTDFVVLSTKNGNAKVRFFPRTGRTHQIRVHCAHPDGLGCPILGDALYGSPSDRLYLHSESITFTHPITCKRVTIYCKCPF